jgi:hypothetical protein
MGLFTDPDILRCNENSVIGKLVRRDGKIDVWKTPGRANAKTGWIGIFNRDNKPVSVELGWVDLGLDTAAKHVLKDLWTKTDLPASDRQRYEIPADGVVFLEYRN